MGTGKEQAELWGPGARDWSDYNEPMCTPFYEAVLDATEVGPGTTLLDVGCGGGFAMLLAARRGATVSGIDVAPALLDIARERVPGASVSVADLEDSLPFQADGFDVVTAFNSVQYAANPVAAFKNMSQVTRPGGLVSVVVWGPPAQCESGVMFAELGPLLPPSPPGAPGAIAWSEDGQLEQLAATAGLTPLAVRDVPNPLIYPDLATAVREFLSEALISIVPSLCYENSPNVVLESFACGTAVVASNHGSLRYMIDDGKTGFLFQPGSADDLAQRISLCMENPGLISEMGKLAREKVEMENSEQMHVNQLLDEFEKLINFQNNMK